MPRRQKKQTYCQHIRTTEDGHNKQSIASSIPLSKRVYQHSTSSRNACPSSKPSENTLPQFIEILHVWNWNITPPPPTSHQIMSCRICFPVICWKMTVSSVVTVLQTPLPFFNYKPIFVMPNWQSPNTHLLLNNQGTVKAVVQLIK